MLHYVPSIWISSALRRRAAGVVDYSTIPSRVDEVVMRAALLIRLPLSLLRHTYRHYSVAASEREMAAHAASGPSDQPREAPVVEAVLGRDDLAKAFRDVLRSSISTGLNTEVGVYNHSLWLGATSDDRIDENVLMNDLMQVCLRERARAAICVRERASPCGAGGREWRKRAEWRSSQRLSILPFLMRKIDKSATVTWADVEEAETWRCPRFVGCGPLAAMLCGPFKRAFCLCNRASRVDRRTAEIERYRVRRLFCPCRAA